MCVKLQLMPACAHLYDVVRERWPEITVCATFTGCPTVKLIFPCGVTLMIRPVRTSKNEKVSFMFGDIGKIISFDWRNLFACKGNPQLTVEPLQLGRRRHPIDCSAANISGNHCHFAPNALISTSTTRVCAIDSNTLHLHYYPHEMDDMCGIIDAVFRCTDNTDYDYKAPLRSIAPHRSIRPPRGPATPPESDEWRKKWVRR